MVCDKLRLGDEQMKHVAEKVVNYFLKRDYIEADETGSSETWGAGSYFIFGNYALTM